MPTRAAKLISLTLAPVLAVCGATRLGAQQPDNIPQAPRPQIESTPHGLSGSVPEVKRQVAMELPMQVAHDSAPATDTATDPGSKPADPESAPMLTMAPHSENARYWVSGQANSICQMHGHFRSPYEGPNSLIDDFETKASEVATLYLGYQLKPNTRFNTDLIVDLENAGGRGISQALGLAGETNIDVVRNPNAEHGAVSFARRDSPDHWPDQRDDRPGSEASLLSRPRFRCGGSRFGLEK